MFHQRNFYAGLAAEESVALNYQRCGFRIIERRYKTRFGEVDLIAAHGNKIYFVEVKKSKSHDVAATRITSNQISRIRNAALTFVQTHPIYADAEMRFDAALVNDKGVIQVIPNAF